MKLFLILLGLVAAGVLGYRIEPGLRYQLTGILPDAILAQLRGTTQPPAHGENLAPRQPLDPATLSADQLPAKVTVHSDVKVSDAAAEITMTIQAGNHVRLLRIEGTNAVVSPGEGPYSGTLPISETDLMEQLATGQASAVAPAPAPPADDFFAPAPPTDPVTTDPASDPATPAVTDPFAPAPPSDPPAASDPFAPLPTGDVAQPPAEPAPMPEPEPAPVTQPAEDPATPALGANASIGQIMQASLRSGQIKEFTLDQVTGWKVGANETIDGETFAVGLCTYTADTIFGSKSFEVKALIKDGKVLRWVWPNTGTDIK